MERASGPARPRGVPAPAARRRERAAAAFASGSLSPRLLLVSLISALMLAMSATGASAVIVRLEGGQALSYQPLRSTAPRALDEYFSNLDYNGGPVMPSNTNYPVYWAPTGSPEYPADYQPGVDQYLEALAHDSGGVANVDSVSAQYNDAAGEFASYSSKFGGALIDTDPYPANGCKQATICLTDAQLQTELTSFVKAHGLPMDLTHEYFLLTPPGVEDCFTAAGAECSAGSNRPVYCAYHGDITVPGGVIVYANDPYVTGNFGCDDGNHPNGTSDGALEGGLSHEHNESITDPEPNNAWTDYGGTGGEIGDKCRTFEEGTEFGTALGTASDGAKYNQVIDGHLYWYQQEWSNQTNQCLQRLSFTGEEPTATFTSTPGAGEKVSFDATGSTAPGGVLRYNWQFNDGLEGATTPTETSAPTVSHTFPKAGVYTVALTVFSGNGTSIGTARTLIVGSPPRPAITRVAPSKGPAEGGTSVKITGTNLASATSVAFGPTSAAFAVKSATSILAIAPAGAAGTVDVTVTTPVGTSAIVLGDHFKYTPTIGVLAPNAGSKAGGTHVTVTGSGFALGTTSTIFKFGTAKAASVNCSSTTSCAVVAPAHAVGTIEVTATVNKVASAKSPADRFTYS